MTDTPSCDLCGALDPSDAHTQWLAVMLVLEDVPHPCGFVLCDKCKSTSVLQLEKLARARWALYLQRARNGSMH